MTDRMDEDIELLFDVLPCESRAAIADATGWTLARVGRVLNEIRRPEVSREWGFTVPHVARGTGEDHLFHAVILDEPQALTDDEKWSTKTGLHSSLAHIATMGENEAHAIRTTALHLPTMRRQLNRLATLLEGASAMAEEAREKLVADLEGE